MTDIIIYTTPEKLLHKQDKLENDPDKSDEGKYHWRLNNFPKNFNEGNKLYFAAKGFIRGYFIVDFVVDNCGCEIGITSSTWKDITPIPITHFQGFKYADKVSELTG